MSSQFNSSSILYYPTIEFANDTWVKASLLFWDKIYRIVPSGYKPRDNNEIKVAKSNGFIEDLEINEDDLKNAADGYEKFCISAKTIPQGLDDSQFNVRLHTSKIDERLKPYFKEFSKNIDKNGFLNVPKNVSNGYMFYLSDVMGRRRGLSKITDDPDFFTAMGFYDMDGSIDEYLFNYESEIVYTNLIVESLIPSKISLTSMEDIINLTNKFKDEKTTFRNLMNEFSIKLSGIQDSQFIQKEIEAFQKTLTENNNSKKEILSGFFSDFNSALLCVGIPTSLPSFLQHIGTSGIYDPHGIASDITICTIAALTTAGNGVRQNWSLRKKNYYLELKNKIDNNSNKKSRSLALQERMKEFISD